MNAKDATDPSFVCKTGLNNITMEKDTLSIVTLKKGEGRSFKAGGLWIYDNEIDSITGRFTNGDIVLVNDFVPVQVVHTYTYQAGFRNIASAQPVYSTES